MHVGGIWIGAAGAGDLGAFMPCLVIVVKNVSEVGMAHDKGVSLMMVVSMKVIKAPS